MTRRRPSRAPTHSGPSSERPPVVGTTTGPATAVRPSSAHKPRRAPTQCELPFRTHGGRRAGAGRKRQGSRASTPHRARPVHARHQPLHVTLRATPLTASLRAQRLFGAFVRAFRDTNRAHAGAFRVVHFSVQRDHVHLVVEAEGTRQLSRGMRGLVIRMALRANRVLGRRGRFWGDRWHGRVLRSPREVRNALVYVLMNHKRHLPEVPCRGHGAVALVTRRDAPAIDPCASGPWLLVLEHRGGADGRLRGRAQPAESGWRGGHPPPWTDEWPTAAPRTWLLREGWTRAGRLSLEETPAEATR